MNAEQVRDLAHDLDSRDSAQRSRAREAAERLPAAAFAGLIYRVVVQSEELTLRSAIVSLVVIGISFVAALPAMKSHAVTAGSILAVVGSLAALLAGKLIPDGGRAVSEVAGRLERESSPELPGAAVRLVMAGSASAAAAAAARGLAARALDGMTARPSALAVHRRGLLGCLSPLAADPELTAALLRAVERMEAHDHNPPIRRLCEETRGSLLWPETYAQPAHCLNALLESQARGFMLASLLKPAAPHLSETLLHAESNPAVERELLLSGGGGAL